MIFFYSLFFSIRMTESNSSSNSNLSSQNLFQQNRITSLRPQCLNYLRFPAEKTAPRTHLLAFMSEFLDDKEEIKTEQIDDFCCFDRMRRLIQKNKMNGEQSREDKNKMTQVIQVQAKINKIESNLLKQNLHKDEQKEKRKKIPTRQHFFGRQQAQLLNLDRIQKIKQEGYQQYIEWYKKNENSSVNQMRMFVQKIIQQRVLAILEERDTQYQKTLRQNKNLQRKILEKNLEIETLKAREMNLKKKINELQVYRRICSENTKNRNQKNEEIIMNFEKNFPGMTVDDVKKQIEKITNKCLERFNDVECKNLDKWNEEKQVYKVKIQRLEKCIEKMQKNENQILTNLKNMRYQQNIASAEIDSLAQSKVDLENLQKKILAFYNDWYGQRAESEKGVLKSLGLLKTHYQYEDMLEYIISFGKKFSTEEKVNEYLIKVLRGIQRIRNILYPKQNNQKLDPFIILQKVQKFIRIKIYQMKKSDKNFHKKSDTFLDEYLKQERQG